MPKGPVRPASDLEREISELKDEGKLTEEQEEEWREQAANDILTDYKASERFAGAVVRRVYKMIKKSLHIRKKREPIKCHFPGCNNNGSPKTAFFCGEHKDSKQAKKAILEQLKKQQKKIADQLKELS